jgi:hypothetical protein
LTGFGPFQAPPQERLDNFFFRANGGGGIIKETETRDPKIGRRGGEGGGFRASEGLSGPPGGLSDMAA